MVDEEVGDDRAGRADVLAEPLPLSPAGTRPAGWIWVDAWDPTGVATEADGYPRQSGWYVGGYRLDQGFAFHLFVGRFDATTRTWVETTAAFSRRVDDRLVCVPGGQWGLRPGNVGGSQHPDTRFWALEPGSAALGWGAGRGWSLDQLTRAWSRGLSRDLPLLEAAFRIGGQYVAYGAGSAQWGTGGYDANSNTYAAYVLHAWGLEGEVEVPISHEGPFDRSFGTFAAYRAPGGDGGVWLCKSRARNTCGQALPLSLSR